MSTRWKVVGASVALAVLVGGTAWAASDGGGPATPASGATIGAQPGSAGRPGEWRNRLSHVTHATVNIVVRGEPYELTIEHGILTAVGGDSLTVKELDGRTATVPVSQDTRVRLDGQPSSLDALKVGDRVFTLEVGTNPARFVVAFDDRVPAGAGATTDGAVDQAIAAIIGSAA